MTQTQTLTEFLLARIAEGEATALDALKCYDDESDMWFVPPTRVLAEYEAKRRIVKIHADGGESQGYTATGYGYYEHCCEECGTFGEYGYPWPCVTLRALSAVYSGHPDYRIEWKP